MTRYLLDTNIFIYLATDVDSINSDVYMTLIEPDAMLYISSASVMEMVVGYIAKGHKDPFDHMIISHTITEKMTLVSSDHRFPFYRRQGLSLLYNAK